MGAGIDPGAEHRDLRGREPLASRRHGDLLLARNHADEAAGGAVAGLDDAHRRGLLIEAKTAHLLRRPVADVAALGEQRLNVAGVIGRGLRIRAKAQEHTETRRTLSEHREYYIPREQCGGRSVVPPRNALYCVAREQKVATVTIEIDAKWQRIVRSPLYWIVAALQGVSISFAPLFLYWSGRGMFHHGWDWIIVPSSFVVIYVVGLFYMRLGGAVIAQLRKL